MANVQMPAALTSAIQDLHSQTVMTCADALAAKYGFDPEEAKRFLAASDGLATKSGGKVKASKGKTKVVEATGDEASKPKRAKTGYLVFMSEMRPTVTQEMILEGDVEKVQPQEVIKELARRWKALSEDEKEHWKTKAKTPPASSSTDSE